MEFRLFGRLQRDPYQEYMTLREQLINLIQHDRDESEEGEELRTRMDQLWFKIPEEQRRSINKDVVLPMPRH